MLNDQFIQGMMDRIKLESLAARTEQLRIGELMLMLKQYPPELKLGSDADEAFRTSPKCIFSYRGYYDEVAINPFCDMTVGDLLKAFETAINSKTVFQGYKGGDFVYDKNTPVWFAEWGDPGGGMVVGVSRDGDTVTLETKKDDRW